MYFTSTLFKERQTKIREEHLYLKLVGIWKYSDIKAVRVYRTCCQDKQDRTCTRNYDGKSREKRMNGRLKIRENNIEMHFMQTQCLACTWTAVA
jgi:hypothetical protein